MQLGNAHRDVRTREVSSQRARSTKKNIFEVFKLIVIIYEKFSTNKCSPGFPEIFITLLCNLLVRQLHIGQSNEQYALNISCFRDYAYLVLNIIAGNTLL